MFPLFHLGQSNFGFRALQEIVGGNNRDFVPIRQQGAVPLVVIGRLQNFLLVFVAQPGQQPRMHKDFGVFRVGARRQQSLAYHPGCRQIAFGNVDNRRNPLVIQHLNSHVVFDNRGIARHAVFVDKAAVGFVFGFKILAVAITLARIKTGIFAGNFLVDNH